MPADRIEHVHRSYNITALNKLLKFGPAPQYIPDGARRSAFFCPVPVSEHARQIGICSNACHKIRLVVFYIDGCIIHPRQHSAKSRNFRLVEMRQKRTRSRPVIRQPQTPLLAVHVVNPHRRFPSVHRFKPLNGDTVFLICGKNGIADFQRLVEGMPANLRQHLLPIRELYKRHRRKLAGFEYRWRLGFR